jgi:GAF domain-containing protein
MAESDTRASDPPESLQLLAEEVVLDLPAVELVLSNAARAAAAGVGLSCGITYLTRYGVFTVASSDERANAVDEMQYGAGDGPCLEALHSRTPVRVDDLATETRWGHYRELALQAGVRSSLSLPLIADERAVGALNVYSTAVGPLPADQEAAALLATSQVIGVLHTVRLLAAGMLRDPDTVRRFQARHELDIATGMLMVRHSCSDARARAMLTEQATERGIAVPEFVAGVIASGDREPGATT